MWISKKKYEKLIEERRDFAKAYLDVQIYASMRHALNAISEAQEAKDRGNNELRDQWLEYKREVSRNALDLITTIGPIAGISEEQLDLYRKDFEQYIK